MLGFQEYTTKIRCYLTDTKAIEVFSKCTYYDIEYIYMCDNNSPPSFNHVFWIRKDDAYGLYRMLEAIEEGATILKVHIVNI